MFKSIVLLGAIAFAAATEIPIDEESQPFFAQQDEASNNLVEVGRTCSVNPSVCRSCYNAANKRAVRWRQIVAWRNAYQKNIGRWYHAYMAKRAKQLRYWGVTYYAWIRKQY